MLGHRLQKRVAPSANAFDSLLRIRSTGNTHSIVDWLVRHPGPGDLRPHHTPPAGGKRASWDLRQRGLPCAGPTPRPTARQVPPGSRSSSRPRGPRSTECAGLSVRVRRHR